MMCNYKKQFFIFVLFVTVVTSTFGRRSGGGSRSRSGGSKSTSHSTSHIGTSHTGTSHSSSSGSPSYPRQTYSPSSGSSHTNYGWRSNTGGNKYNSNTGHGHYYNSPPASSSTNWGSSYNSPSPQNAFGTFHPVSSGIAPSYHFHRSTSYVPIYIPSSHTYIHRHYTNTNQQTSTTADSAPPPPPSEPVVYKQDSEFGESSKPTMIVGFNNMIVYGVFESEKHFVITISEDLDDDTDDIPEHFLRTEESSLFEIVTLKPTTTTTTTTTTEAAMTSETSTSTVDIDDWTTDWRGASGHSIDKDTTERKNSKSDDRNSAHTSDGAKVDDDVLNLYFGDMML